jgi:4-hydroxythreonine-4-phosphate dehydrogenase
MDPYLQSLSSHFSIKNIPTVDIVHYLHSKSTEQLYVIERDDNPTQWVYESTLLCTQYPNCSLVTAPLSKETSLLSSHQVVGHTDLFRKTFPQEHIFMAFLGPSFNIALLTDHIPLHSVTKTCTKELLQLGIDSCLKFRGQLSKKLQNLPIAILGMNPHGGENGIIGSEELAFKEVISSYGDLVEGPLVPDAAFLKKNWPLYSLFLCLYHDQGLIPFKMIHGQDSGIQVSMGLPFLRTSVDHGTAKTLFNKNLANPNSMIEAILFARNSL